MPEEISMDDFMAGEPVGRAPGAVKPAKPVRTAGERFTDSFKDSLNYGFQGVAARKLNDWADTGMDTLKKMNPGKPPEWYEQKHDELITATSRRLREEGAARQKADPNWAADESFIDAALQPQKWAPWFLGQMAGAVGPEMFVGGPAGAGIKAIAGRIGVQGAANAAADVAYQGADIAQDVSDKYSPEQTAFAGLAGAGFQGAFEGLKALGRGAKARFTTPENDPLSPEARADLNAEAEKLWAEGASAEDMQAWATKNGMNEFSPEQMQEMRTAREVPAESAPDEPVMTKSEISEANPEFRQRWDEFHEKYPLSSRPGNGLTDEMHDAIIAIQNDFPDVYRKWSDAPFDRPEPVRTSKVVEPTPESAPVEAAPDEPSLFNLDEVPPAKSPEPVAEPVVEPKAAEPTAEAAPAEPTPPTTVERLTAALQKAGTASTKQKALVTAEFKKRVAALLKARGKTKGEAGLNAELAKLKGELPKADFEELRSQFTQKEVDELFDLVKNNPELSPLDGVNARVGLRKMLEGRVPAPKELELLGKVFPKDLVKALLEKRDLLKEAFGKGGQAEMFSQSDTLATGPIRELLPEGKPSDPTKFVDDPKQGDFFKDKPKGPKGPKDEDPFGPTGQAEMFPGSEVTSSGPIRELLPEPKAVDPTKYVDDPKQGDFFKDKPGSKPKEKAPKQSQEQTLAGAVLNLPRSLMSSMDLSAPFRQGVFLVGRGEFWKAMPTMFREFVNGIKNNDAAFNGLIKDIEARPTYSLMEDAKLAITKLDDNLTTREEAFMSPLAERIPGVGRLVKGSERAYAAFLNKLRADTFDSFVELYGNAGIDLVNSPKALKDMGSFINAATGRGNLPKLLEPSAPLLNGIFFSPRLLSSRVSLLNPAFYARLDPVVRKEAIKALLSFGAIATTVIGLAKMGGADVEANPKSSDFAKIRVGNTRYDVTGGFGQYITLGARMATNESISAKGTTRKLDGQGFNGKTKGDVLLKFGRNKLSPVASFVTDYFQGSNTVGKPFDVTTPDVFENSVTSRFIPMFAQDYAAVLKDQENPVKASAMVVPGFFGFGAQTYDETAPFPGSKADKELKALEADPVTKAFMEEGQGRPATDGEAISMDDFLKGQPVP